MNSDGINKNPTIIITIITIRFQTVEINPDFSGCAHHHGLSSSEVWQQLVLLHDVAGHFPECPQVARFSVDQDLTLHPYLSGQQEGHECTSYFNVSISL